MTWVYENTHTALGATLIINKCITNEVISHTHSPNCLCFSHTHTKRVTHAHTKQWPHPSYHPSSTPDTHTHTPTPSHTERVNPLRHNSSWSLPLCSACLNSFIHFITCNRRMLMYQTDPGTVSIIKWTITFCEGTWNYHTHEKKDQKSQT